MPALRSVRSIVVLFLVVSGALPAHGAAQDASPAAESSSGDGVIVASGLTHPRGITFGLDGAIFASLAGGGGPSEATETAPTTDAVGPWTGGPTGAVARIDEQGCPVALATGLPSSIARTGRVLGADDVAILGDQMYVAVDGGGAVHGNPDMPSGVYQVLAGEEPLLIADLSTWSRENPPQTLPDDYDPDAAGYGMVADENTGILWVVDPNVGYILGVSPFGEVFRIADVSAEHPVPTRPVLDPDGGIYVGTLGAAPFTDGGSRVMHVAINGTVTDVWTGLTAVADVAVGEDGALYALEMSIGNLEDPPYFQPGSGRIVRQTGPDSHEVVVDGLMFPIALEAGPDGGLYVSLPALGASDGSGVIVKFGGEETAPASTDCAPIAETLYLAEAEATAGTPLPETPPGDPIIEPPAAGEPEPTAGSTPVGDDAPQSSPAAVGANQVSIEAFSFAQTELTVPAGSSVTFVNNDTVAHTASARDGSFSTGNIAPGESVTITFDQPGSYGYACSYHPNMKGVITVER